MPPRCLGGASAGIPADMAETNVTGVTATEAGAGSPTLIEADRARDYQTRWNAMKGKFVDEPRSAVRDADELVTEVLDELHQLFHRQRAELERGLDDDRSSTEDLRQSLGRYRALLDRLLTV